MTSFIEEMRDLIATGEDLPTLPDVVFQLHAALEDEFTTDGKVAAIIEKDPAVTARLLKAANSALFQRGTDRIGSVQAAVQRIGLRQVHSICLVIGVVRAFSSDKDGLDHQQFWSHSVGVALVARHLARLVTSRRGAPSEDIYVAGLLHDVGLLVLDQHFPEEFADVRQRAQAVETQLWQAEDEHLGMDHGEIGSLLLGRWSLPKETIEAVSNHHHPEKAPETHRLACDLVHAAEIVCTGRELALPEEGPADGSLMEALASLGFDEAEYVDVVRELDLELEHAGHVMAAL